MKKWILGVVGLFATVLLEQPANVTATNKPTTPRIHFFMQSHILILKVSVNTAVYYTITYCRTRIFT